MSHRGILSLCLIVLTITLTTHRCAADDTDLFSSGVNPHVLIILDLSDSMKLNMNGEIPSDESTSRLKFAKEAIKSILNADEGNPEINDSDYLKLKIEFGYMRFLKCTRGNLGSCIEVRDSIGSPYQDIWSHVNSETIPETPAGFTPIAGALEKAKDYFERYEHNGKLCAAKFIILVTDGNDTLSCDGMNGIDAAHAEHQKDQYKRRRASIAAAKALADMGIKVFIVGFGSNLNELQKNTLNWMAYYGGTDNPAANVPASLTKSDTTGFYTSIIDACSGGAELNKDIIPGITDGCSGASPFCFAKSNDPGKIPLSGYAFTADDVAGLAGALKSIIGMIRSGDYSFTPPLVSSVRITDDDKFIYTASFEPSRESFWPGHLRKYPIGDNGAIGSAIWDAGEVLQNNYTTPGARNIYTCKDGGVVSFDTAMIDSRLLGTTAVDEVVNYVRGELSAYNPHDRKKLGDIFHSAPVVIGKPACFFLDFPDKKIDSDGKRAFDLFREANGQRKKVIYAGANDAQLHALDTRDGSEIWSFIPPNFLPRLQEVQHASDSDEVSAQHQFFLDGPITAADIWIPSPGNTSGGTSKDRSEWHTYLVFGEGKGGGRTLWSRNGNCETEFNSKYSSDYSFYCGYYALDVTNTGSPNLKWILHPNSEDARYFGQPWGKPAIGRALDSKNEIWLGFLGGGFEGGKGVFAFRISDGEIMWRKAGATEMKYDFVATPLLIDTDQDGFIDRVYAADLGGNIWRFKLCKKDEACGHTAWDGQIFFQGPGNEKIFTSFTAARDNTGRLWIYWGTGDKSDPSVVPGSPDRIYGAQDDDKGTFSISSLGTIDQYNADPKSYTGWYYSFSGRGEKMLSDPEMIRGILYFTTYVPADASSSDSCYKEGYSNIYAMHFMTGQGALEHGMKYKNIGTGMASSVKVSVTKNGIDAFVSRTHGNGKPDDRIHLPSSEGVITSILYWHDKRIR